MQKDPIILPFDSWKNDPNPWTRWVPLFKYFGNFYHVQWRFLMAIALIESQLGEDVSVKCGLKNVNDPNSISKDGLSFGLMQMTIKTAKFLRPRTSKQDLNNPEISVELSAEYLAYLRRNMIKKSDQDIIRGYNGGPYWESRPKAVQNTSIYWYKFKKALAKVLEKYPDDSVGVSS